MIQGLGKSDVLSGSAVQQVSLSRWICHIIQGAIYIFNVIQLMQQLYIYIYIYTSDLIELFVRHPNHNMSLTISFYTLHLSSTCAVII